MAKHESKIAIYAALAGNVDTEAVATQAALSGRKGPDIGKAIHDARVAALGN